MFKNQPPHGASEELLTALGQTMEEKPVIGTPLTDPVTGQPVMQDRPGHANKDHNDALGENPNPAPDVGVHLRRPVRRPRHHLRHHDPQRAAVRPRRHHQLPHAPLRPRRHLRAGPQHDTRSSTTPRPGQVPDREDVPTARSRAWYHPISRHAQRTPDVVYDVPRDRHRQGDHRRPPQRPDADHPPAPRGHADVPQQAGGLHARNPGAPGGRVRVGPAAGPVALPVDGDPRVPARHRGQGNDGLGVQGSPTGVPIINIKYYKPTNPLGRPFIPVEFSVAAYRFGHSIARPRYTVRDYRQQRRQAPWPSRACHCSRHSPPTTT